MRSPSIWASRRQAFTRSAPPRSPHVSAVTEASVRDRIQTGELLLTEEGETVAWKPSADGSALEFFGVERRSLFTTERIYRLSLDAGPTMGERSAAPGTLTERPDLRKQRAPRRRSNPRDHHRAGPGHGLLVLAVDLGRADDAADGSGDLRARGRRRRWNAPGRPPRHPGRSAFGRGEAQRDAARHDQLRRGRPPSSDLQRSRGGPARG